MGYKIRLGQVRTSGEVPANRPSHQIYPRLAKMAMVIPHITLEHTVISTGHFHIERHLVIEVIVHLFSPLDILNPGEHLGTLFSWSVLGVMVIMEQGVSMWVNSEAVQGTIKGPVGILLQSSDRLHTLSVVGALGLED